MTLIYIEFKIGRYKIIIDSLLIIIIQMQNPKFEKMEAPNKNQVSDEMMPTVNDMNED